MHSCRIRGTRTEPTSTISFAGSDKSGTPNSLVGAIADETAPRIEVGRGAGGGGSGIVAALIDPAMGLDTDDDDDPNLFARFISFFFFFFFAGRGCPSPLLLPALNLPEPPLPPPPPKDFFHIDLLSLFSLDCAAGRSYITPARIVSSTSISYTLSFLR